MSKEDPNRYLLEYPSNLQPRTRLWVTQEGDLFVRDGVVYETTQVVRPRIKGARPQIVLRKQEEFNASGFTIPF